MFDYFRVPGATSVHERKVAAWALFIGERGRASDYADRSVRPHRGMLPDIDPTAAISSPPRPSLIGRLVRAIARRRPSAVVETAAGGDLSDVALAVVGNSPPNAYIDEVTDDRLAARDAFVQIIIVDQFRAA